MFVAMQHCVLLAQTVTFFFPSIVTTLGYDNYTSKSRQYICSRAGPTKLMLKSAAFDLSGLGGNLYCYYANRGVGLEVQGEMFSHRRTHVRDDRGKHHDHQHNHPRASILCDVFNGYGSTVLFHGHSNLDIKYFPAPAREARSDHRHCESYWECIEHLWKLSLPGIRFANVRGSWSHRW